MHWGNKIILVFVLFGAFIFYLVYRSMNVKTELVEDDYYKKELEYQKVIDATKRTNSLKGTLSVTANDKLISIALPEEMKKQVIKGTVWFYCESDASKDLKNLPLTIDTNAVYTVDATKLRYGKYTVKVEWFLNNEMYYAEKDFIK